MSGWNYRVIRTDLEEGFSSFAIHEVYYYDDGKIMSWSIDPIHPIGETAEELKKDLKMMVAAFKKPVLVLDELESPYGED